MTGKLANVGLYSVSALLVVVAATLMQNLSWAPALGMAYYCLSFFAVCALDRQRNKNVQDIVWAKVWRQRGVYMKNGMLQVAPIGDYVEVECPVAANGISRVDRMLGYLFVAPLILPAELFKLVQTR